MLDNFWNHVEKYRKLGFDPTSWIPGGSNELDPALLRSALQEVKKSTVKISPSWFDSFYHIDGKKPELTRRVYRFAEPSLEKEVDVKRALLIMRIHRASTESPQVLSDAIQGFLKPFSAKVSAACTSALLTDHKEAQFGMFDYIELHRGDKVGFMPAVTAVTQVTDVTKDPDADVHSSIAMTSAIERLNLLGCTPSSSFKLFPVYDAPTEEILDHIRSNLDAFTSRYNLAMEDYNSLKINSLLFGTSALATTAKELPTRYDQTEEGMDIIVTNKFGGLAEVALHTLGLLDPENIAKYEKSGVQFESIVKARDDAIKNLSEPHFALGKIIAKYLPDFGTAYDKSSHLTAVYPIGHRGVFALGSLAELSNAHLAINELPLRNSDIARFATKDYLVENATGSLNGCHLIVATKEVASLIAEELGRHNFSPEKIGSISKKGVTSVTFNSQNRVEDFVASKLKLDQLLSQPAQPPAQP